MVTITLAVGGGNTTVITVPDDETVMHTRNRGDVRADQVAVNDVLPTFEGSCCAVLVADVVVS